MSFYVGKTKNWGNFVASKMAVASEMTIIKEENQGSPQKKNHLVVLSIILTCLSAREQPNPYTAA